MNPEIVIPALGIMTGIIVPLGVFVWLYLENKDKNKTILEISKNIDDPSKLEDLVGLLDERKKEPIDYRRSGVVTLFVGIGLFLFGVFFLGNILKGVGALVAAIGIGQIIAGYLYPNTSEEITNIVDEFEKKWPTLKDFLKVLTKSIKMGKNHQNLLNNLEELRKACNLTQQDLSESADVSRKSINAIENGIYVPSTVLALKIAKTLKCKVEDIFKLP